MRKKDFITVYHVTSYKKFKKYLKSGVIKAPVRAWKSFEDAVEFSKKTGRQIILRLRFPKDLCETLEGHKGRAVYLSQDYPILEYFKGHHKKYFSNF